MRRHGLVLAVAAALVLAGCTGGGGGTETREMSQEAQTLQEHSVAAMQEADTYRVSMTMDLRTVEASMGIDAEGVLNRPERRMRMNMSLDTPRGNVDASTYIVDETAYVKAGPTWRTRNVSERNLWDQNSQLERQRELMEAARLEIVGNDTVDGVPVRVVEFHIPDDKLDELTALAQQQAGTDEGSITDASYTAYLSTESDLMRKMEADFEMEIEGQTADATVTMRFSDFGTETDITVPEEATANAEFSTSSRVPR
jgi:hypothetical protein